MKERGLGRDGYIHHVLLGLTLLLVAVETTALGEIFARVVYALVIIGSVAAVYGRRYFTVGVGLGAPALIAVLFEPGGAWAAVGPALGIATLTFVCGVLLEGIHRRPGVSAASVSSSLTIYLFLGIIWSMAYLIVETQVPGSFYGLGGGTGAETRRELFYFSFVTLATLGYGDIGPATEPARALAILEAVVAQLYLVVLVASLVGMFLEQRSRAREDP